MTAARTPSRNHDVEASRSDSSHSLLAQASGRAGVQWTDDPTPSQDTEGDKQSHPGLPWPTSDRNHSQGSPRVLPTSLPPQLGQVSTLKTRLRDPAPKTRDCAWCPAGLLLSSRWPVFSTVATSSPALPSPTPGCTHSGCLPISLDQTQTASL